VGSDYVLIDVAAPKSPRRTRGSQQARVHSQVRGPHRRASPRTTSIWDRRWSCGPTGWWRTTPATSKRCLGI